MRAARLYGAEDVRLDDEPVPVPGPGETLIRVNTVGLCGSDLLWFSQGGIGDASLRGPLVLGHEFAGIVASGEEKGLRVAVDPAIPCGTCDMCRKGHPNLCPHLRFAGHAEEDGALREYLAWPASCLHPLPDRLSDAEGALLEPLGVALHALDLGRIRPGESAAVLGCGPIGLLLVQLARVAGAAPVLATERLPHRLEAARKYGAWAFPADGSEVDAILEATDGRGVDVAFEAAGENSAVEAAVAAVRPGGRVVLVGIPADDRTGFRASVARRKGLTLFLVRRMKHAYPRALRLVETGQVDLRGLITHRFPLEKLLHA
ncbi:MAG: zinc-dependent alcohol dehydrogenase, partial [Chloroflexia bacterium]